MLILTRKIDQGIVISGNICIRVLGVQGDRVKIGISAPLDIAILREELLDDNWEAKEAPGANKNSAGPKNGDDSNESKLISASEERPEQES